MSEPRLVIDMALFFAGWAGVVALMLRGSA
jgi:hypothetical protein